MGDSVAARTCVFGEIFSPERAHALGMVNELVPAGEVLDRAVAVAEMTPEDCLQTYAFTKRACQVSALRTSPSWLIGSIRSCPMG